MYRYTPQILKVIELIKNDTIGKLVSMDSSFGVNLLTKKNIFGLNTALIKYYFYWIMIWLNNTSAESYF